ncbi:ppGpp synthetase/RelA/SpoT-type nucleotidyltransferase [Bradyrhizobium japonicum]
MQVHTDRRAGIGLLFLIIGKDGREHKIVLSRFPTDSAILVEEDPRSLEVAFLERVFMKNKTSYKAVLYRDASLRAGFWDGKAIDKQTNPAGESADYWIADFLASDFRVTPKQGTSRLATTLQDAIKTADIAVKQEIVAAATLARTLPRISMSINEFANRFNLSAAARESVSQQLRKPKYQEPLAEIQDQVGARIITYYQSDVARLDPLIQQWFRPIEYRDHVPESHWEFGYFGRHYILAIPSDVISAGWPKEMIPRFFELQVKTLFEHAWSEAEHDLGYKPGEAPLTPQQTRSLAYTSAQAWGADKMFDDLFRECAGTTGGATH